MDDHNPPASKAKTRTQAANGRDDSHETAVKAWHRTNGHGAQATAKEKDAEGGQDAPERDWSKTLFLPKTSFGMKAGLPQLEPKLLERWAKLAIYKRLRKTSKGKEKFILHDGPPYANGNIHIGTGVNKILKDAVVRSQQMMGKDANYVPGFDCHGLPIEWKIEEQYRAKGKTKDSVSIADFRRECRAFAQHWIGVQTEEFKRLGVEGDWEHAYATMAFEAEAAIAGELLKFAMNGSLYRGSKPVMWSVVEGTALAEAEVEYHEHTSPAVWVKFPLTEAPKMLAGACVLIWTTTPWTIPGNRAISYSSKIAYGLYEVTAAPEGNWTGAGERFVLAKKLADSFFEAARVEKWKLLGDVNPEGLIAAHPLHDKGYEFKVPLLDGEHVTEDAGTGFVHTAPGHGADDFEIWTANTRKLIELGIDPAVPETVGPDGRYFSHVPLFGGSEPKRVIDDKGSFGKPDDERHANAAVIAALKDARALAALNPRHKHDYPHSWRSKAPVIFRNTPQWFIAIDKPIAVKGAKGKNTIRQMALAAIDATRFVPAQSRNRLRSMIEARPDYVISRQRVWGVPIAIFVHKETGEIIPNAKFKNAKALIKRITDTFAAEGVDPWFAEGAAERFLAGLVDDPSQWEQVRDILDVWFDSASTHVFVLKKRRDLKWPADVYLEGSDQHRGWFHSSLLESCGTTGRAPYDCLVTHGFVLDERGRKMSKSLGNTVAPQDVIKQSGADILRLWALSSDYTEDMRVGPHILQSTIDAYRKLRNTLRYMLGNLVHFEPGLRVPYGEMPELERWVLHRLCEIDAQVRKAYHEFDFKRVVRVLSEFCSNDLSALYFDIRKDTLYCEPYSSLKRKAALTVLDTLFEALSIWLAPILCFTAEEAWLARYGEGKDVSVHLAQFPELPQDWLDLKLAAKWEKAWAIRGVITGALEIERRDKRIGSSLEAAPQIHIADRELAALMKDVDFAEIAITSSATVKVGKVPAEAFSLDQVPGVGVIPRLAQGRKCARSWRITKDVGSDKAYPTLSARDAAAVRELEGRGGH